MTSTRERASTLLIATLLLIASCGELKLHPPGPSNQTLLIVPVELDANVVIIRHGFYFVYEITKTNDQSFSHDVEIRFPVKHDFIVVDSLLPGDYYVRKFSFLPTGSWEHDFGNNTFDRYDRFSLESGRMTVFSKSLKVTMRNDHAGIPDKILYNMDILPVTPSQEAAILETLKKLPNFDAWDIVKLSTTLEERLIANGYNRLNSDEIEEALGDKTLHGKFGALTASMFVSSNGTMLGKTVSSSGVVSRDRGTWKTTPEGLFCDTWNNWRAGTDCDHVFLRGSEFVLMNLDGTKSSEGKIEHGNSRGL